MGIDEALDMIEDVIIEKKTREEYAKKRFKEKYDFKPDKPGSSRGTINIDGKRQKVDIGNSNTTIMSDGKTVSPRQTGAWITNKDPEIVIANEFWKTKNNKRRDALLQHEVGHTKLHSLHPDSKTAKPGSQSKVVRDNYIDTILRQNGAADDDEFRGAVSEIVPGKDGYKENDKKYTTNGNKKMTRQQSFKYADSEAKKSSNNFHTNGMELEADRYSANRTSEKQLKRGLRDYYSKVSSPKAIKKSIRNSLQAVNMNNGDMSTRQARKTANQDVNFYLDKDSLKENIKNQNKLSSEDYKTRSKALSNKTISQNSLYK